MMKKIDKYIFSRLLTITFFVLGVLIFVFVVIHFSDHSEDFTDNGAKLTQVFGVYYPNYIPEIIRLVMPVAVFVACLYLTGQMAERFEIAALKAAGISLYRLLVPYLIFGFLAMATISYLDGFVIPITNAKRFAFEHEYLNKRAPQQDNREIYRQESGNTIMKINYYDPEKNTGYRVQMMHFSGDRLRQTIDIKRMQWIPENKQWLLKGIEKRTFKGAGFTESYVDSADTSLTLLPQDLARTTSDVYQLTYPQAHQYIQSLERSGASSVDAPKVQFYGRLAYPFSILVVCFIGFAIACERRKGGKGFYIAAGLAISFVYLSMIKIIEPFGNQGVLPPSLAVAVPHLFFLLIGLALFIKARK